MFLAFIQTLELKTENPSTLFYNVDLARYYSEDLDEFKE